MKHQDKKTIEENAVPVNAAGGGAVAGIGIGSQAEPGINSTKKNKRRRLRDIVATT